MAFVNGKFLFPLNVFLNLIPEVNRKKIKELNLYLQYHGQVSCDYKDYIRNGPSFGDYDVVEKKIEFNHNGYLKCENASILFKNDSNADIDQIEFKLCLYTSGKPEKLQYENEVKLINPITKDSLLSKIHVNIESFFYWYFRQEYACSVEVDGIVESLIVELIDSCNDLKKAIKSLVFDEEAITFSVSSCDNEIILNKFYDILLKYLDRRGVEIWEKITSGENKEPEITNDIQFERSLESELNGRLWFDLNGLVKRWDKSNISKEDILHFAENGKLEICFDWLASPIRDRKNHFKWHGHHKTQVSKLIEFEKLQLDEKYFHTYKISSFDSSKLSRLCAISRSGIKEFISRDNITNPVCKVNDFILSYYKNLLSTTPVDDIILTEKHLRVTAREVRLFEKDVLGINDLSAPEKEHKLKSSSNSDITDGAWLTLGILRELLLEHTDFKSKADIKAAIMAKYPKLRGISDRNLDDILKKGTDMLEEKSKRN
jgi:hypothetical protein